MNQHSERNSDNRRIDAHMHVWDLDVGEYAWLGPQHGPIYRTFTPGQAKVELDAAGLDGAVLVQAEDSARDTAYMLDVAAANPWVLGVVGWIPLDDTDAAANALDDLLSRPVFCGVRHLVHDDPRDDFLSLPAVRASAGLLADQGVPLDVPNAWPRHLVAVAELAADLRELVVIVDHLAKPPLDGSDLTAWRSTLARVAEHENTVSKFSGLGEPSANFTTDTIRGVWDAALELFGPSRLLYGGDWPMTVAYGGYQSTFHVMSELIGELSASEQTELLSGTAQRVYHRMR